MHVSLLRPGVNYFARLPLQPGQHGFWDGAARFVNVASSGRDRWSRK